MCVRETGKLHADMSVVNISLRLELSVSVGMSSGHLIRFSSFSARTPASLSGSSMRLKHGRSSVR